MSPTAYDRMREMSLAIIEARLSVLQSCWVLPSRSVSARNENLDATVLGSALGRVIIGNRDISAFAIDGHPIWLRKSLPQQNGDRPGALQRQVPVRRESDRVDRAAVRMSHHFEAAGFLVE